MGTFQKKKNTDRAIVQGIISGLIILKDTFLYPQLPPKTPHLSVNEIFNEITRQDAEIRKGYEIIPDRLFIRYASEEDIKRIKNTPLAHMIGRTPTVDREALIELYADEEFNIAKRPNIIDKTLLALRLLKEEPIFIHKYWMVSYDNKSTAMEGDMDPLFGSGPAYFLKPADIEELRRILGSLNNVDFDKNTSYQIACDRFGRSYSNIFSWDQIIDLCIAFEALYSKGETISGSKGEIIGLACSMLLGETNLERAEISNNLRVAYKIRNKVVHGSTPRVSDFEQMIRLGPILSNYLRKSLLKLIPV